MKKTILITTCFAAMTAFSTFGASAQTPTTPPQTGTTAPSVNDASKTGSQTEAGGMQKPGMAKDGMTKGSKNGMSKDNMSKDA